MLERVLEVAKNCLHESSPAHANSASAEMNLLDLSSELFLSESGFGLLCTEILSWLLLEELGDKIGMEGVGGGGGLAIEQIRLVYT